MILETFNDLLSFTCHFYNHRFIICYLLYSLAGCLYCSLHLPLSTPESQRPVRLSTAATRPISSLLIAPCPHL